MEPKEQKEQKNQKNLKNLKNLKNRKKQQKQKKQKRRLRMTRTLARSKTTLAYLRMRLLPYSKMRMMMKKTRMKRRLNHALLAHHCDRLRI